jgi:hypothetical protein
VDEGFDRVDARFDKIDDQFGRVDSRFDRMEARIDGAQRSIMQMTVTLTGGMLAGFAAIWALIATQL